MQSNLRRANLHDADLSRSSFQLEDLRNADLSHTNLNGTVFQSADLRGANLSNVYFDPDWRIEDRSKPPDFSFSNLSRANLTNARLSSADLYDTNLSAANLSNSWLDNCRLTYANLKDAILRQADLSESNLNGANLSGADLSEANLSRATISRQIYVTFENNERKETNDNQYYIERATSEHIADLTDANLKGAILSYTNLNGAILRRAQLNNCYLIEASLVGAKVDGADVSGSTVYGINVWDLEGDFKEQRDLIITRKGDPKITIDNIKVAQFVYLILDNKEIRDVINELTSKTVLILGRFSIPERKALLDRLRNELRKFNLLPIVFDFDRPTDKDFTETIKTLAGLSFFVIADVTNPKSSPLELQATVPDYQIPFVPIIQEGEQPFSMMDNLQKKYDWVLKTVTYDSIETLIKILKPLIIDPAMKKRNELRIIKAQEPEVISGKDFLEKR
jgi:uncharacterized protein YjbI with pentapeptide repeats